MNYRSERTKFRHEETLRRVILGFLNVLCGPGGGEKKMREQKNKREGKMRHRLLMHLGIAALCGWKGDMEGGERKGAILMLIQNRCCFSFCACSFPLLYSPSTFQCSCDHDGHVREVGVSYPSFS